MACVGTESWASTRALRAPSRGSPARRSTNERLGPRTAHGNGTAFTAVAPSERPVLPSIDPIFGSGIPQARMVIQHSTPLSVPSGFPFSWANLHCLILCHPFATYRPATRSAASTICRCIAATLGGSVCACVGVAPTQHSASFTGTEGRARIHSEARRVYSPCS